MATGFNRQTIIGNLAADAELRYTESGKAVANFRVIANTGSGDYEHAEGFNVTLWGKLAESLTAYLTKGKQVLVEGETRTRSWNDKETGQKRYRTEVVVTPFGGSIVLLGGGNGKRAPEAEAGDIDPQDMPGSEEDIPF